MISPSDSFSASFDAIALDAATARSPAAIDAAVSACAAPHEPGFYLLDDADGRFVIDRDFGVVSLRSDALLEAERDAVHLARVLVIEQSGERYELALRLKLTGMVPQAVIADDDAVATAQAPRTPWTQYCAGHRFGLDDTSFDERAPFGALLSWAATPYVGEAGDLSFKGPAPRPASRAAIWPV